jgi:uncharacterized lipoprotein YehR (DUF1307 family)
LKIISGVSVRVPFVEQYFAVAVGIDVTRVDFEKLAFQLFAIR